MNTVANFSQSYAEARQKFLAAARAVGGAVEEFAHPLQGPDGGALATDVARLGDERASRVLFLMSATHGVEGFCGSGCQIEWLSTPAARALPKDVAVVLIHAINPHGFAWERRVTEDNVDLNRNCLNHNNQHPANPGYTELRDAIKPREWTPEAVAAADKVMHDYADKHGEAAWMRAVHSGQYDHADGIFYGGRQPTWSNRTLRTIVARYGGKARFVASIDFHTGLGPYGYGDPMLLDPPEHPATERAIGWYGDFANSTVVRDPDGTVRSSVRGHVAVAIREAAPQAEHTPMGLEYGTCPKPFVFKALRADNWLHLHGDLASPLGRAIKADVRKAFYREEDDWKLLVALRGRLLIDRAIKGIAAQQ